MTRLRIVRDELLRVEFDYGNSTWFGHGALLGLRGFVCAIFGPAHRCLPDDALHAGMRLLPADAGDAAAGRLGPFVRRLGLAAVGVGHAGGSLEYDFDAGALPLI